MASRLSGTPIDPTLVAASADTRRSVAQRVYERLTGWFGPGSLPPVVAPITVPARSWDYPSGFNLRTTPRGEELTGFPMLRALADGSDSVRIVIETVKSRMARFGWSVRPLDPRAKVQPGDARVQQVEALLRVPDRVLPWNTWLRKALEEVLVVDALTIFRRPTRAGGLYALEIFDGGTIRPVLDERGNRPDSGTAYRQIIKGMPTTDFTADELIYRPRNPRSTHAYGFGPTEQILVTINLALRRVTSQLEYYSAGNIPDMIVTLPEGWSAPQVEQFAQKWASFFEGGTEERRKVKFVPGGAGVTLHETRLPPLKDEFDEWLLRKICFAFDIPPTAFIKQTNRATGEIMQDVALEEGTLPLMGFFQDLMTYDVIHHDFGFTDLGFFFDDARTPDARTQSELDERYLKLGVLTINEVRQTKSLDPVPDGDQALIYGGANGAVRLADILNPPEPVVPVVPVVLGPDGKPLPPEAPPDGGTPPPRGGKPPAAAAPPTPEPKANARPAAKRAPVRAPVRVTIASLPRAKRKLLAGAARATAPVQKAERALAKRVRGAFVTVQAAVLAAAAPYLAKGVGVALRKDEPADIVDQVLAAVDMAGFTVLIDPTAQLLGDIGQRGATQALATLTLAVPTAADFALPNAAIVAAANARAAELVGMRTLPDGSVGENPNAAYAITDGTRELLRGTIAEAFAEQWSKADLATALADSYAFSDERAALIARTEISNALVRGNLETWKASGEVAGKEWVLGSEHDTDDECLIGDMRVSTGALHRTFRRHYRGTVVDVDLSSGHRLTGTPNHPVLTDAGWKPLHLLKEGDYLLSGTWLKSALGTAYDFDHVEARLEEVVGAFTGRTATRPTSAGDFHGDGIGSHVHTVTAHGLLHGEASVICDQLVETAFRIRTEIAAALAGLRRLGVRGAQAIEALGLGDPLIPACEGIAVGTESIARAAKTLAHGNSRDSHPHADCLRGHAAIEVQAVQFAGRNGRALAQVDTRLAEVMHHIPPREAKGLRYLREWLAGLIARHHRLSAFGSGDDMARRLRAATQRISRAQECVPDARVCEAGRGGNVQKRTLLAQIKAGYAPHDAGFERVMMTAHRMASCEVFNLTADAGFFIAENVVTSNCDSNAAAGVVPIDAAFPSGDDAPTAHPRCVCDLLLVLSDKNAEEG
jgi:hypothetical protein